MDLPSVIQGDYRVTPIQIINDCISQSETYNQELHTLLNHLREIKQTIEQQKSHIEKQEKLVGKRIRATNSKKATLQQKKRPKDHFFVWKGRTPKMNCHQEEQLPYKVKLPLQFPVNPWKPMDEKKLLESIRKVIRESKLLELAHQYMYDTRPNSAEEFRTRITHIENIDDSEINQIDESFPWDKVSIEFNLKRKSCHRTAQECQQHFFNVFLKNNKDWSKDEDLLLRKLAKKYNEHNWDRISEELGANRSAFDCLSRYQRSLSTSILKSKWSPEEDSQLKLAVEKYGEHNWQEVARHVGGRTGQQCLHRWTKAINPHIEHGKWNLQQDKKLFLGVHAYGEGNWAKISKHIMRRTDVQCRERWHNVLNPDVTQRPWSAEEDKKLEYLTKKFKVGNWSTIARHLEGRTDNQCWRRWKALNHEIALDGYTRRLVKGEKMLPQNFVGREKDRSTLTMEDVEELTTSDEDSIEQAVRDRRSRKKRKRDEFENSFDENNLTSQMISPIQLNRNVSNIQQYNRRKEQLQEIILKDPNLENISSQSINHFIKDIQSNHLIDKNLEIDHIQLSKERELKFLPPYKSNDNENTQPIILIPRNSLTEDNEESRIRFKRLVEALYSEKHTPLSETGSEERMLLKVNTPTNFVSSSYDENQQENTRPMIYSQYMERDEVKSFEKRFQTLFQNPIRGLMRDFFFEQLNS